MEGWATEGWTMEGWGAMPTDNKRGMAKGVAEGVARKECKPSGWMCVSAPGCA